MKTPAFRRSRLAFSDRHAEDGITMVLVAICLIAIIAMAALSIDVITLYLARSEAQRAADSAALAAARVISISGITGAADPDTDTLSWQAVCGNSSTATAFVTAQAVAQVNSVGGIAPNTVDVRYSISGSSAGSLDCSGLGRAFAINPTVIVKVTRSGMPTLFSRIWRLGSNTVSATAVAEAFNASDSAGISPGGELIPAVPRCVKPWVIPNKDPGNGGAVFVDGSSGQIKNPGIVTGGSGVIGERLTLSNDCSGASDCDPDLGHMLRNSPNAGDYIPALVSQASSVVPSCAVSTDFQQAVGGCDNNTTYACGSTSNPTQVDLSNTPGINPGPDTSTAVQCLIRQTSGPGNQDSIDVGNFPFQIEAGKGNPLAPKGQVITSSNSIVTVPIYANTGSFPSGGVKSVNIVGFLQVFINSVDASGNIDVYVLNVVGCGNNASTSLSASGTSPVPIRLINSQ